MTRAPQQIDSAMVGRTVLTPSLLKLETVWDPLRGLPRFQELLKKK